MDALVYISITCLCPRGGVGQVPAIEKKICCGVHIFLEVCNVGVTIKTAARLGSGTTGLASETVGQSSSSCEAGFGS